VNKRDHDCDNNRVKRFFHWPSHEVGNGLFSERNCSEKLHVERFSTKNPQKDQKVRKVEKLEFSNFSIFLREITTTSKEKGLRKSEKWDNPKNISKS
jgi:hypothetical protein